ncbi:hypothetical protein F9U64_17615 [Gracilibacillus oryzae]|uniref:Uncharacterized protein n=1 Tax=Gracilibacillus oryzae TaxID=1672701 RepID=A0A7C8KS69_9BACI|nr:hypothetical protein [Gracilibacillus oryzae]KAB8127464.1 hypothetical protein F9U64_17615 [Gracilibacillus oryzae]
MDGHLVKSLVSCKGSELRMLYFLLFQLPGNILSLSQTKFAEYRIEQEDQLADLTEEKMHVDIFLEMTKICKLRGMEYTDQDSLFAQSSNIFHHTYKQIPKENQLKAGDDMEKEQLFIQYHLNKINTAWQDSLITIDVLTDVEIIKRVLSNNRFAMKSISRHKIIEMVVAFLLLKNAQEVSEINIDPFLSEWQSRYDVFINLHHELIELEIERDGVQNDFDENQTIINEIQKQIRHAKNQIILEKKTLQSILKYADLDKLKVNPSFEANRQAYEQIQQKIGKLYRSKSSHLAERKLLAKLSTTVSNMGAALQIKNQERKANYYLSEMVEDLLSVNIPFKEAEQNRIKQWEKKIKDLEKWETQHKKYQEMLKNELIQSKYQVVEIQKHIKQLEKENYGLAHLEVPLNEAFLLED